ncbi:hypothetical protein G7Y89_g6865 [Cudoniella acicularis]|uniref:2EXR domain-containing protein n=1 Tax=Cudoniella acicularis TaxID=354080 RepID=A0A8H4RKG7_9HELO|nr:hypothetical protein G7Y89_g6865 [Cudoniella acicularis]
MPPRRRHHERRDNPARASKAAPDTFHKFGSLPLELRLSIWSYMIKPDFVRVLWDSAQRVFWSPRTPPAILHACQESRHEGLKTYKLCLAPTPEFARVYIQTMDIVAFDWSTLGAAPGRLGRKLSDDDYQYLQSLMIHEIGILQHVRDGFREIERFSNLKEIAVICDDQNPEMGDMFGEEEMVEMATEIDNLEGPCEEVWPELVCLRSGCEHMPVCSRHWWFDGWNQRSRVKQKKKWPTVMADCFIATQENDTMDASSFFFHMMMSNAFGLDSNSDDGNPYDFNAPF